MRVRALLFLFFLLAISSSVWSQPVQSKWATLDGNKIHYYDVGITKADKALVLIHGWTCNADFWKDSRTAFPAYRVISIDLPGHGRSDKPRLTYSMEHFAKAVHAVVKKAGVKRAVLVGHSMGTPVARQFYRLYPDQTLGLVAVDGALQAFFTKEVLDQFFAPLRADYNANAAKFVDGMLEPIKDEALKKIIRDSMLATPEHVGLSALEGMADEKIWIEDRINVPVLAIMAPSPAWPQNIKERYLAIAPNLDFHMWMGVSHFLHMEKPKEFNETVRAFVIKNKLL
ncbi:MAG TPA: alpha/beta hydrolase [Pyrinomonadaceae bacterium]